MRLRADMLHRLREFFDSRGFLEVETPILSADTVVDRHLDPFQVTGQWSVANGQRGERGEGRGERKNLRPKPQAPRPTWLQTSPEFHMKRLLAAGSGPIYQVARVFRQDELGPLHNPEFTMIEWYQPGDGMDEGMQLTADLCEALLAPTKPPPADTKPRPVVAPEEGAAVQLPPQRNVQLPPQRNVQLPPQRNVQLPPQRDVKLPPRQKVELSPQDTAAPSPGATTGRGFLFPAQRLSYRDAFELLHRN